MTANEAQYEAGRRWARHRDRWAPHTTAQALEDHEAEEARDEARQTQRGGNR